MNNLILNVASTTAIVVWTPPPASTAIVTTRRARRAIEDMPKPPKPYPGFPLFPDNNGYWRKKIGGRHCTFGRWASIDDEPAYRASWQSALARFEALYEQMQRGATIKARPELITLGELVGRYLADSSRDVERREIGARHFAELRQSLEGYRDAVGASRTIAQLIDDPTPIRAYVDGRRDRYGWCYYNRLMRHANALWTWAAAPMSEALPAAFKWKGLHASRKVREFRRERREARARGVRRTFDAGEVRALIDAAGPTLRAAILLGYHCAFGNGDVARLPRNAISVYDRPTAVRVHGRVKTIPAGWALIDFPRPKTELDRFAIVPPHVVAAVRAADAAASAGTMPDVAMLALRSARGTPLQNEVIRRDAAGVTHATTNDLVGQQFERLVRNVGRCPSHGWTKRRPGVGGAGKRRGPAVCPTCGAVLTPMQVRGFYALRATATTIAAGSVASSDARALFEGHATGGVRQTFYLEPTELHELLVIARELDGRLADSSTADAAA